MNECGGVSADYYSQQQGKKKRIKTSNKVSRQGREGGGEGE
jgi:hypothetical protein